MSQIFISYNREDRPRVKAFAGTLERRGYSVWWDRKIPLGKTFDQVIQEALDKASCIIVLWSRNSITSNWVKEEAEEGAKRGILLPILIDDVAIPLGFGRIQTANLAGWNGDTQHPEFRGLMRSIAAMAGTSPQPCRPWDHDAPLAETTLRHGLPVAGGAQDAGLEAPPSRPTRRRKPTLALAAVAAVALAITSAAGAYHFATRADKGPERATASHLADSPSLGTSANATSPGTSANATSPGPVASVDAPEPPARAVKASPRIIEPSAAPTPRPAAARPTAIEPSRTPAVRPAAAATRHQSPTPAIQPAAPPAATPEPALPKPARTPEATLEPASLEAASTPDAPRDVAIPDGTEVRVRLLRALSSADARMDEQVQLEVVEAVEVDGVLVIAKDAIARGRVVSARHKKSFGRKGRLDFSIDSVKTVDGQDVRLRYLRETRATSKHAHAGVMTYLKAPFGFFTKGKDVQIPAGTEYSIFIDGDRTISLKG